MTARGASLRLCFSSSRKYRYCDHGSGVTAFRPARSTISYRPSPSFTSERAPSGLASRGSSSTTSLEALFLITRSRSVDIGLRLLRLGGLEEALYDFVDPGLDGTIDLFPTVEFVDEALTVTDCVDRALQVLGELGLDIVEGRDRGKSFQRLVLQKRIGVAEGLGARGVELLDRKTRRRLVHRDLEGRVNRGSVVFDGERRAAESHEERLPGVGHGLGPLPALRMPDEDVEDVASRSVVDFEILRPLEGVGGPGLVKRLAIGIHGFRLAPGEETVERSLDVNEGETRSLLAVLGDEPEALSLVPGEGVFLFAAFELELAPVARGDLIERAVGHRSRHDLETDPRPLGDVDRPSGEGLHRSEE